MASYEKQSFSIIRYALLVTAEMAAICAIAKGNLVLQECNGCSYAHTIWIFQTDSLMDCLFPHLRIFFLSDAFCLTFDEYQKLK